jgi:hypothetical protein
VLFDSLFRSVSDCVLCVVRVFVGVLATVCLLCESVCWCVSDCVLCCLRVCVGVLATVCCVV